MADIHKPAGQANKGRLPLRPVATSAVGSPTSINLGLLISACTAAFKKWGDEGIGGGVVQWKCPVCCGPGFVHAEPGRFPAHQLPAFVFKPPAHLRLGPRVQTSLLERHNIGWYDGIIIN